MDGAPPARVFAVCTDSDRPEELAAWWAALVGADVGDGPDGTPRWLYGCAGWEGLIWKFVRVDDERVVPNRWRSDPAGRPLGARRRAVTGWRAHRPAGQRVQRAGATEPSGLSSAAHICRGLMKPSNPVAGHRGASRRRGRHGGSGRHPGVVPHRGSRTAGPALRPGLDPLRTQHVLGHPDLLGARRRRRIAYAAVGGPGGRLELQAAVVAVAGVGGPVPTRLALCDGVPVQGVRARGARRQGHRDDSERPGDSGGPQAPDHCFTNVHHCGPSPTV